MVFSRFKILFCFLLFCNIYFCSKGTEKVNCHLELRKSILFKINYMEKIYKPIAIQKSTNVKDRMFVFLLLSYSLTGKAGSKKMNWKDQFFCIGLALEDFFVKFKRKELRAWIRLAKPAILRL